MASSSLCPRLPFPARQPAGVAGELLLVTLPAAATRRGHREGDS
jgi:hypothetical protein